MTVACVLWWWCVSTLFNGREDQRVSTRGHNYSCIVKLTNEYVNNNQVNGCFTLYAIHPFSLEENLYTLQCSFCFTLKESEVHFTTIVSCTSNYITHHKPVLLITTQNTEVTSIGSITGVFFQCRQTTFSTYNSQD